MKRIRVPGGMLKAALRFQESESAELILEASLRWLSEHPIVPNNAEWASLLASAPPHDAAALWLVVEWQRRCFQEEEPEIPADIEDLLYPNFINAIETVTGQGPTRTEGCFKSAIIEAYRRGKQAGLDVGFPPIKPLRKGEQK